MFFNLGPAVELLQIAILITKVHFNTSNCVYSINCHKELAII